MYSERGRRGQGGTPVVSWGLQFGEAGCQQPGGLANKASSPHTTCRCGHLLLLLHTAPGFACRHCASRPTAAPLHHPHTTAWSRCTPEVSHHTTVLHHTMVSHHTSVLHHTMVSRHTVVSHHTIISQHTIISHHTVASQHTIVSRHTIITVVSTP